jgi:hypothetical protein
MVDSLDDGFHKTARRKATAVRDPLSVVAAC